MSKYHELQKFLLNNQKTWLITGVAGFVGSNLLEKLLVLNQKVVGIDNFDTGYQHNIDQAIKDANDSNGKKLNHNFKFINGDIRSLKDCENACNGVNYVLHQAALGSVPRSIKNPINTNRANIDGFLNMLVASKDANVERFVYENYYLCSGGSVDISATPDGVIDKDGLLEIKCPDIGRSCFDKGFPEQYLCQIVMQQMVVNKQDNDYDIKYTYFFGWSPTEYKLWLYERDLEFEEYVDAALLEYAKALVSGGKVQSKPKDYKKVFADVISKIKLIKHGE